MKKVLLLVICPFLVISLFAQDRDFSLGFTVSPNIGWISNEDDNINDTYSYDRDGSGAKMGFSYGVSGEYHFTENYHLALGIHQVFTGGKLMGTNSDVTKDPTVTQQKIYSAVKYGPTKFSYLHIPFLLRLKTNEIGYIRYFGNIGFAFDFALSGKSDLKLTGKEWNTETNSVDQFSDRTFSSDVDYKASFINPYFVIGAGGQYSLGGNSRIHLGINYNTGMGNVISNDEIEKYSNIFNHGKFKNSYISIELGIFL